MKAKSNVLVCVTGQRDCDRLIRVGRTIADDREIPLQVLCVQPASAGYDANCEELEYLRQTAKEMSAEMTVYFHDDAALIAVGIAKQTGTSQIVTGMAGVPSNGFIDMVHQLLPEVPIAMVSKEGIVYHICPSEQGTRSAPKLAVQN